MAAYDVCNGDADGLFALRQLRLAEPLSATLITGLKREIALLQRVPAAAGDQVTVLDLSLARNREALERLLAAGAYLRWYDHHEPGAIPSHPNLQVHIDTDPRVCTSMLVDRALAGRFRPWAIAAAYGDNLTESAQALADTLGLDAAQRAALQRLGEAVNYNAYGEDPTDAVIAPAALFKWLTQFDDAFAAAQAPLIAHLEATRQADLAAAEALPPQHANAHSAVYVLPDAPWSRRVLGSFANRLAQRAPDRAHAVLRVRPDGTYLVSVRAPLAAARGADTLARAFGGGGRPAAAGIDRLPQARLPQFVARFASWWATD
ncbi:MAG: DHHA1 domain-containing protein [Sutterellaceae bacterium]|nr:DHHA1 domain-containing protein [Burkholderiaceae bacterium]MCX7901770.1 DHHA1 domain-containing protein [Burkholderiaceae bacterium]MDW8430343.1 DHHA1 domain-containing protein [Sutterellaceae bacterium]